jgi:hypothetical protein
MGRCGSCAADNKLHPHRTKKSEGFGLSVRRLRTRRPKASDCLPEGFGQTFRNVKKITDSTFASFGVKDNSFSMDFTHVRILQFQGIMGFKSFLPRNHRFLGRKPKVSRQETFA